MYDVVAKLKTVSLDSYDQYGNMVEIVTVNEVYVQPRGIYASEFYQAAQNGMKPELSLFIANRDDYDGQKLVEFNGKDYDVIRVDWSAQRDGITLVCEERVGLTPAQEEESDSGS